MVGTRKTALVEYVRKKYHNANVVRKYTTRSLRNEEGNSKRDLIFLSEEEFENKNFNPQKVYTYGGKLYGFDENELVKSIEFKDRE